LFYFNPLSQNYDQLQHSFDYEVMGKGEVHQRTDRDNPEGESRYSFTLSLTSAIDGVRGQCQALTTLSQGKRPGTHFTACLVIPKTVWTDAKNFIPIGIRFPDRLACSKSLYRLSYPGPQTRLSTCQ